MNPAEAERWKSELLDQVFVALAASDRLVESLIFKGARVLNLRLGGGRQSLDLDSNLAPSLVERLPNRQDQQAFLEAEMAGAIRRHFERQEPVRYELTSLRVRPYLPQGHPMGWDAFIVRINVTDRRKAGVLGLPAIEVDVAAPEQLLDSSVSPIEVGGNRVRAYTLERIAGEKMRAFLSSLPAYRAKVKKPGEAVRARDLYDLARIRRVRGIADEAFWGLVGREFRLACQSRYIDCDGMPTFQQQWEVTRTTYEQATIPRDIPFAEAEATLAEVVEFWRGQGFIPFAFPLPQGKTDQA